MAQPGLLQRGLQSLNDQVKALRTGEGKGPAARFGRSMRNAGAKAKGGLAGLKTLLGLTEGVDAYEEDHDDQRRKKRAQELIGSEGFMFVAKNPNESRNLNATVAPEFRAQVAAGLASANSFTAGSTLADAPGSDDGEKW